MLCARDFLLKSQHLAAKLSLFLIHNESNYILKPSGTIMDSIYYDRIADKLIQFRSKFQSFGNLTDLKAQWTVDHMVNMIDALLQNIDQMAELDAKGWIK